MFFKGHFLMGVESAQGVQGGKLMQIRVGDFFVVHNASA
jgi:hypothetical protein